MTIEEAILHAKKVAQQKYNEAMLCHTNPNDEQLDSCIECAKEHEQLADWLEELKQYQSLGTVEECKTAIERMEPLTPNFISEGEADGYPVYDVYECPHCEEQYEREYGEYKYCPNCGQAMNWDEE